MRPTRWFSAAAVALLLWGAGMTLADEKKPLKELPSFSLLRAPAPDAARSQALAWLKGVGKADTATLKAFDALWATDRPLLDKVTRTFALGDPAAAQLLKRGHTDRVAGLIYAVHSRPVNGYCAKQAWERGKRCNDYPRKPFVGTLWVSKPTR